MPEEKKSAMTANDYWKQFTAETETGADKSDLTITPEGFSFLVLHLITGAAERMPYEEWKKRKHLLTDMLDQLDEHYQTLEVKPA